MTFGYELVINAKKCKNITRKNLKEFIYKLCKLIDMKRYRECQVVYFGKDRFKGFSVMQFITTSSIVGHFTKEEAYLNIFSCKSYDKDIVVKFVKDFFDTRHIDYKLLRR